MEAEIVDERKSGATLALDVAVRCFHHGEAIIQTRLYNYLMAATILFLSWASLFQENATTGRAMALALIAVSGALLSAGWLVMGFRHRKFLDLLVLEMRQIEVVALPPEFHTQAALDALRTGATVERHGIRLRLTRLEVLCNSRNLAIIAPAVLGIAFVLLLGLSWGLWRFI